MLVQKMKDELGITFKYTDEAEAEVYLSNVNNYLRTVSYRKIIRRHLEARIQVNMFILILHIFNNFP